MSTPFQPNSGLVIVDARLEGPKGGTRLQMAIDTGASRTLISNSILTIAGYDPSASMSHIQMTTGSGVERVPVVTIAGLRVLGREKRMWPIIGHTLPPSASIDGLLGLDFFRGLELKVDFRNGLIDVA
jgi:predicted aspartyl protease